MQEASKIPKNNKHRCHWVNLNEEIYVNYHDKEWGKPSHDDRHLFEMLILEGAQAGLSWITILKRREEYRKAFDGFDYKKIAKYNDSKIQELLNNKGIIRNRLKILSAVKNAKAFIEIQKEFGSFNEYIWKWTDYQTINNNIISITDILTKSELSDKISKDLKKRGMSFVGSVIIYSYLQAIGIINDHENNCFCK